MHKRIGEAILCACIEGLSQTLLVGSSLASHLISEDAESSLTIHVLHDSTSIPKPIIFFRLILNIVKTYEISSIFSLISILIIEHIHTFITAASQETVDDEYWNS